MYIEYSCDLLFIIVVKGLSRMYYARADPTEDLISNRFDLKTRRRI